MSVFLENPPAEMASLCTVEDSYPLSPMQQGMMYHSIYDPRSGVDIEQMVYTLHENLNVRAFVSAWQRVIDRHPILRSSFRWEGLDEPVQEVNSRASLEWRQEDWRGLSEEEQHDRLADYLGSDRRRGFDLSEKTLNRMALFRAGDSDYEFIWTFHHAIIDGRSFVTVLKEAFAYYESFAMAGELELPLPRPYRDYIEWLGDQDLRRAEDFWREELKGFASPTQLVAPLNDPLALCAEPGYTEQGVKLSAPLTSSLKKLAAENHVSLNNMAQGAWALLLARYGGESDVIFGATRACRRSTIEGAEAIVGPLINTLPMRVNVSEDMRLMDWLRRIRAKHVALRGYEHTPLAKIQEWSEVPNGKLLFDSILVFENYELDAYLRTLGADWETRDFELLEQTNYPLALSAWAGPELLLKLAYDQRNFDDGTIGRMLGHLKTLLEGMVQHPSERIGSLPMLTEEERRQLIFEWNETRREHPKDACIHQLFEAQVRRTPEATAILFGREKLSYRDLNAKANQMAHHLRALGVGPESLVGIFMGRSLDMVVGMMAVLKAGGAYVPIDPAYPKERLAAMLEDSQPVTLLTRKRELARLPACDTRIVCLDSDWKLIAQRGKEDLDSNVTPENLAYVIYTSGSSGRPKGVMIEHRSLVNHAAAAGAEYDIKQGDRVLQFASISFDASAEEIYPCLTRGATLVVRNDSMLASISSFLEKCGEWRITVLDLPTAYWHELCERLDGGAIELPESVRLVIIGGERASPERLAVWSKRVGPRVRLVNTYGPTEATVVATAHDLTDRERSATERREVPIGRPVSNAQTYVLDARLRPVPVGVPGELHIGGAGVARGYLNRPDLTSQKFIADPFAKNGHGRLYKSGDLARYLPDGSIEFRGRVDNQVKIHGFRIELGDIESAAAGCPLVKSFLVVAREDAQGDKRLVAYIVPAAGAATLSQPAITRGVKDFLRTKLPAYMVPSTFVTLDDFPLNRNGKIDLNSLPVPDQARAEMGGDYVKPGNPLEYQLAQVWEELFDIRPIGITDNFFDLGGHSLLSVRMIDRIEQVIGKKLPLATLLSGATIEKLAAALLKQESESLRSPLVEIQAGGSKRPFFYLHGDFNGGGLYCVSLSRHLGKDQPFYALQPHGMDGQPMPRTIEAMAEDHIKTLRGHQPEGPYLLGGHCNGALIAFEMARQLEAQGAKVDLLVLICAEATNARYRQLQDWVNHFCLLGGLGVEQAQDYFLDLRGRAIRLKQVRSYYAGRLIELSKSSRRKKVEFVFNKGLKGIKSLAASFARRKQVARFQEASIKAEADAPIAEAGRQEVAARYVKAMTSYVPRRYSGRVTLLCPSEPSFEPSNDPTYGWRYVAAEVDARIVPGGHLTCITKHNYEMAQILRERIDEASR